MAMPGLGLLRFMLFLPELVLARFLGWARTPPSELSGFPYREVRFSIDGGAVDPVEVRDLLAMLADTSVTDLLVLTHGWYNDIARARLEYTTFARCLAETLPHIGGLGDRRIALAGVLWPSMFLADPQFATDPRFAGGGPEGMLRAVAPIGSGVQAVEPDAGTIRAYLEALKAVFPADASQRTLDVAKGLVDELHLAGRRAQFADLLASLLRPEASDDLYPGPRLFPVDGAALMARLDGPVRQLDEPAGQLGATKDAAAMAAADEAVSAAAVDRADAVDAGAAADVFRWAAQNLLSVLSFYGMRERAAEIGRDGLAPVLRLVRTARPDLRIHLAGHSFGGMLVSRAVLGEPNDPVVPIHAFAVFLGAYSHYSYAPRWDGTRDGILRKLASEHRVSGPALIVHSRNDILLRRMYTLLARLSDAAGTLPPGVDPYVALGTDGARRMPPVEVFDEELLEIGGLYTFKSGTIHNLRADRYIFGHNDWAIPEVAYAMLTAIATH
jgi:hypothetical protein